MLAESTQLVGENKFVAKKLEFNTILFNETVMNEFECDDITIDYVSMKTLMNTDFIENLAASFIYYGLLTSPVPIYATDDKITINTTEVMWSKVGNLTLIHSMSLSTRAPIFMNFILFVLQTQVKYRLMGAWKTK